MDTHGYEVPKSEAEKYAEHESIASYRPTSRSGRNDIHQWIDGHEELDLQNMPISENLKNAAQIAMQSGPAALHPSTNSTSSPPNEQVQLTIRAQKNHPWKWAIKAISIVLLVTVVVYVLLRFYKAANSKMISGVFTTESPPNFDQSASESALLPSSDADETECQDSVDRCPEYAKRGDCVSNEQRMFQHCPKSCERCDNVQTFSADEILNPLAGALKWDNFDRVSEDVDALFTIAQDKIDLWVFSSRNEMLQRFRSCPFNGYDVEFGYTIPYGETFLYYNRNCNTIIFFDLVTCRIVFEKTMDYRLINIAISARTVVLSFENFDVYVYRWTGQQIDLLFKFRRKIAYPQLSSNGILAYHSSNNLNEIQVFDTNANHTLPSIFSHLSYDKLTISLNGSVVVAQRKGTGWELLSIDGGKRLFYTKDTSSFVVTEISSDNRNIRFVTLNDSDSTIYRFDNSFKLKFSTTINASMYVSISFRTIRGVEHLQCLRSDGLMLSIYKPNDKARTWDLL